LTPGADILTRFLCGFAYTGTNWSFTVSANDGTLNWAGKPDAELLNGIRGGDTSLYGILADRYSPQVRRAAKRIVRNDADADELLQEAHLNALEHIDQFAGRSSFSTWLTRIAVYGAYSRLRRHPRFPEFVAVPGRNDEEGFVPASTAHNPEQQLLNSELGDFLHRAVASLPDPYRTVFVLREMQEKSTSEAARFLCTSEQCVKTRLHRSKAILRKKLRAAFPSLLASLR
jgi:RNA polymerase sigma-70 factor (ECF subfamily)